MVTRRILVLLAVLMLAPGAVGAERPDPGPEPQTVLASFVRALYSRDAAEAYRWLAAADREIKSRADYAAEIGAFAGRPLRMARALAAAIEVQELRVMSDADRVTVSFDAVIPNANAAAIDDLALGFSQERLAGLSAAAFDERLATLRRLASAGELPALRARDETWVLLREAGGWRVFLNWAEAVEVRFEAVTFHDLGWQFQPLRQRVMARHGETIRMAYRARNIGRQATTGKARHVVGPAADAAFLEIVACFCFLEQTLAPGEAVELPLVFRVDFMAPETVKQFVVRYEFYPADRFPGGPLLSGAGG